MYLLEGCTPPDHATIARFRKIHFAPCSKHILAEVSNILYDLGEISGETIFIDEGFGSLDAETLDTAITTLIELQSYGRNIGIISHVSELKERI